MLHFSKTLVALNIILIVCNIVLITSIYVNDSSGNSTDEVAQSIDAPLAPEAPPEESEAAARQQKLDSAVSKLPDNNQAQANSTENNESLTTASYDDEPFVTTPTPESIQIAEQQDQILDKQQASELAEALAEYQDKADAYRASLNKN